MVNKEFPIITWSKDVKWAEILIECLERLGDFESALELAKDIRYYYDRHYAFVVNELEKKVAENKKDKDNDNN